MTGTPRRRRPVLTRLPDGNYRLGGWTLRGVHMNGASRINYWTATHPEVGKMLEGYTLKTVRMLIEGGAGGRID